MTDTEKAEKLQAGCAALLKERTFYVSRRGKPATWKVVAMDKKGNLAFEFEGGSPELVLGLVKKQLTKKGG